MGEEMNEIFCECVKDFAKMIARIPPEIDKDQFIDRVFPDFCKYLVTKARLGVNRSIKTSRIGSSQPGINGVDSGCSLSIDALIARNAKGLLVSSKAKEHLAEGLPNVKRPPTSTKKV